MRNERPNALHYSLAISRNVEEGCIFQTARSRVLVPLYIAFVRFANAEERLQILALREVLREEEGGRAVARGVCYFCD